MRKYLPLKITTIASFLFLSSCTITGVSPGIDPMLGQLGIAVISENCRIVVTGNTAATGYIPNTNSLLIEDLQTTENGWVIVDFRYWGINQSNLRGQATYNLNTLESECSSSPAQAEISDALVTYSAVVSNASSFHDTKKLRTHIQNHIRPITFSWPIGQNEIVGETVSTGNFEADDSLYNGWISINAPLGSGKCNGFYQVTGHTENAGIYTREGFWNLHCPNAVTATGDFTLSDIAYYKNNARKYYFKTATGTGTDSLGNAIRFKMPWKN